MRSYSQLLLHVYGNRLADDQPVALPDEITLQAIWFNGLFGRTFTTTDGRSVVVRQFGFWNRTAGPDFLHAAVEIDGKTHSGPLELDTHASDWENHGHDTNPVFNDVILHVIFRDSASHHFTRSENHSNVPKVVIPEFLVKEALSQPRHTSATANIGRCFKPLEHMSAGAIEQVMLAAAKHRCAMKAKHHQLIHDTHGKDQSLWIALAQTLGYRPNKQAMAQLAQRMPIHYLRQHTDLAPPLLFGIAGFLHPDIHEQAPIDSQRWLEELWNTWWKHRGEHELSEDRSVQWTRSGIRPINHPQRRLAALGHIAQHWPSFRKLSGQTNNLIEWLENLRDPFWSHHYTLTSKRSDKQLALVGKDRIRDLLINHLLPVRIIQNDETAWNDYIKLPAPATSESISRVSTRLFGQRSDKKEFLKKAWQHQALLQIYHDFCLEDTSDCDSCPFPEQMHKLSQ
ncbi:MAG: DUF2851 family protein [Rubritalea sp.]|uniref:DUF2851 family protein n=1 Tax=Rubritalea sp. TaxID=2109375 RepID=UPI003242FCD2